MAEDEGGGEACAAGGVASVRLALDYAFLGTEYREAVVSLSATNSHSVFPYSRASRPLVVSADEGGRKRERELISRCPN